MSFLLKLYVNDILIILSGQFSHPLVILICFWHRFIAIGSLLDPEQLINGSKVTFKPHRLVFLLD